MADRLNFTKAAEALFMSQPAVSAAIKALETELGLPLFSRAGRQIELTEAGQTLAKYARKINDIQIEAINEITRIKENYSGNIRIGASTTIAQYLLPRLLGEFKANFPDVTFSLIARNTEEIAKLLENDELDLGLIEGPVDGKLFRIDDWLPDELKLNVSTRNQQVSKTIALSELEKIPLIMREAGSGSRQVIENALAKNNYPLSKLNISLELDSTEAIKLAVESGLGAAFLSDFSCYKEHQLKTLQVITVQDLAIKRKFSLLQTRISESNSLVQRFLSFISRKTVTAGLLSPDR